MIIDLTDDERHLIGFAIACYLEDLEKKIKKVKSVNINAATEQMHHIEQITYTKIIPESWHGPKPDYWK